MQNFKTSNQTLLTFILEDNKLVNHWKTLVKNQFKNMDWTMESHEGLENKTFWGALLKRMNFKALLHVWES